MEHQPRRGDDVATWLKKWRDQFPKRNKNGFANERYQVLDDLLDDYRLHADTGTPLLSEEPMQ